MIKRILTYIAMALVLLGCSTDDILLPNGVGEDGSLEFNIAVPQMESVATRADQFAVGTLRMLVFDKDGVLQQLTDDIADDMVETSSGSNNYTVKVNIKSTIRSQQNLQFYFIANYADEVIPHLEEGSTTIDALKDVTGQTLTCNTPLTSAQTLRMSGKASLSDLTSGQTVQVLRNSAKITVNNKATTGDEPGTTAYPFTTHSMAGQASIFAGAEALMGEPTEPVMNVAATAAAGDTDNARYVHPTVNNVDARVRPFIIVQAPYGGKNYYYRVDFRKAKKDDSGKLIDVIDLDIEPNHWYKFIIEEINGVGDETVAAAAQNPSALITVDILDVTPKSYNMVTDGSRELGVSHELVYDETKDNGHVQDLFVKLYSVNAEDYPAATVEAFKDKIIFPSDEWLIVSSVADVTGTADGGNLGAGAGKVYKVTMAFNETASPGTLESEISVEWKGLSRNVPVIWKREFSGSDLCDVTLTIKGYDREQVGEGDNVSYNYTATTPVNKENYWNFLKTVEGVADDANQGTARDEGLHFPLMYGYEGHEWEYEYEVKYKELVTGDYEYKIYTTGSIINTNYSVTAGDKAGTKSGTSVEGTANGRLTVKVTKPSNSWLYTYGEMVLAIYNTTTKKWDEFPLDLYHTGFFHNHGSDSAHWYYYEVLGDDDGNYWLDRNLGATAAGAAMVESDGSIVGETGAVGDYIQAYTYNNSIDNQPKAVANICPPGFMIPREETWNSIRNSSRFVKTTSGGTFNSYLGSTVAGKRIYFPRGRYENGSGSLAGEARAGYYWSSTPSVGFEKEELGNWMQAFVISGSITSYVPAELNRYTNNAWKMNVRCVNTVANSNNMYRTYFSVKGATHVFLYNESNGQRTAATTWPGKAIGDASIMTAEQAMSFVLDSPTTQPGDWYVIFNYKDASGKIHTISKAANGTAQYSDNQNSNLLKGWKVVGDDQLDSKLGGTWTVTYNATAKTANVSFVEGNQIVTVETYKYRVYWPYDKAECNGIRIYNSAGTFSAGNSSYTGFDSGSSQSQTNGKYGKYNDSFAYLEFEVTRTKLSGTYTCRYYHGDNQQGSTCTFTIPSTTTSIDGADYYVCTVNSGFTGATNGIPGYFFLYYYDLEGWGGTPTVQAMNTSGGNIGSASTGTSLHTYWPALYKFVVNSTDNNITQVQFKQGSHTVTGQRGSENIRTLDHTYFNNGDLNANNAGKNTVKPSDITDPGTSRRIAVRQFSTWSNMYIFDWGYDGSPSNPNDKEMIKIGGGSGEKTYFVFDIPTAATGFLFTNGSWGNGNQTSDINNSISSKWKVGKLVNDWYDPGFSIN